MNCFLMQKCLKISHGVVQEVWKKKCSSMRPLPPISSADFLMVIIVDFRKLPMYFDKWEEPK